MMEGFLLSSVVEKQEIEHELLLFFEEFEYSYDVSIPKVIHKLNFNCIEKCHFRK